MSLVELEVSDHLAVVCLNDPDRRNALTSDMVAELCATFDAIEHAAGVRSVVVTAIGPAFCAGADRSLLVDATESPEMAEAALRAIYAGFLRVAQCPLPTVAAVNGPAVGAGMNLALACDVRVCSPEAVFDPRFVQIGLHPGGGHTWMLQRIVSQQTAALLVLFGEALNAQQAHEHGLVVEVVDNEDDLVGRARELAARVATADRELAIRIKATLNDVRSLPTVEAALERELVDQIWSITQAGAQNKITASRPQVPRDARPTLRT